MRKVLILLVAALPLTGCVSAEQLAKRDDATCQSYGYVNGSGAYAECRERTAQVRAYARAQARAAFAAALASTGQMYQDQAAAAAAPAPSTFQTCHTILDPNTNTATTHCY